METAAPRSRSRSRVLDWLSSITAQQEQDQERTSSSTFTDPITGETEERTSRKRTGTLDKPRLKRRAPPSPPPSDRTVATSEEAGVVVMPRQGPPVYKRRRTEVAGEAEEEAETEGEALLAMPDTTPRASRLNSAATDLGLGSVATSSSNRSGRSSPSKQLQQLELTDSPIIQGILTYDGSQEGLPPELEQMTLEISRFARGVAVIAQDQKAPINSHPHKIFRFIDDSAFNHDPDACLQYPSPPPSAVLDVVECARECFRDNHDELSWNILVHHKLLGLAIPWIKDSIGGCPSCWMPCPTAKIMTEFLPRQGTAKMIDFCIHLNPQGADADAIAALREQGKALGGSINHTSYHALRRRPIALSIETKRDQSSSSMANLQIATWQAAQWRQLEHLLSKTAGDNGGGGGSLPPFLPAIIVCGHDWSFVATTRRGGKTFYWAKKSFGTTEDAIGVYQIVRVLQHLEKWIANNYWPWFRNNILYPDRRSQEATTTNPLSGAPPPPGTP